MEEITINVRSWEISDIWHTTRVAMHGEWQRWTAGVSISVWLTQIPICSRYGIFITTFNQKKWYTVYMYNNRWIFQSTTKNKNWRRLLSPFIQQSIHTSLQLRNSPTGHPTGFLHIFSNYHAHLKSGSLSLYYPQSSKYLVSRFDPPHTLWEGLLEGSNTSSQGIRMILDD